MEERGSGGGRGRKRGVVARSANADEIGRARRGERGERGSGASETRAVATFSATTYDANVFGPVRGSQAFVPFLLERDKRAP